MVKLSNQIIILTFLLSASLSCIVKKYNDYPEEKIIRNIYGIKIIEQNRNTISDSVNISISSNVSNKPLLRGYYDIQIIGSRTKRITYDLNNKPTMIRVHHQDFVLIYLSGDNGNMETIITKMKNDKNYIVIFNVEQSLFKVK